MSVVVAGESGRVRCWRSSAQASAVRATCALAVVAVLLRLHRVLLEVVLAPAPVQGRTPLWTCVLGFLVQYCVWEVSHHVSQVPLTAASSSRTRHPPASSRPSFVWCSVMAFVSGGPWPCGSGMANASKEIDMARSADGCQKLNAEGVNERAGVNRGR